MPGDLTGVELKLGRADAHLADLDRSITSFLGADTNPFTVEFDPESGEHVYSVHNLPPIPTDWTLIAGEILFNLRSALDHLAWQLVILDKGEPGEHTKFPIHKEPLYGKSDELIPVNLKPAIRNPKILKALNECQPDIGPNGNTIPVDRHPLHQLRVLNNIDKHRLLLVVAHALDTYKPMWWDISTNRPKPRFNLKPLKEGSPVAGFDFGGADPPADFDPRITLAVVIDMPELPYVVNIPLSRLMHKLCHWVNMNVLNLHFRRLFA